MIEMQLKPALAQSGHFLVYEEAGDWRGKTHSVKLLPGYHQNSLSGWELANCGGGGEKPFSVRKLVTKPEARKGKTTAVV